VVDFSCRLILWFHTTVLLTSQRYCSLICLAGSFKKRKRKSIIVTVLLLIVSVLILIFGLAATTRAQNITVGGYYPGVIVSARSQLCATAVRAHKDGGVSEGRVLPASSFPLMPKLITKGSEGSMFPTFIIQHQSLGAEWGEVSQSINAFYSQHSAFSILPEVKSDLESSHSTSATFHRMHLYTLSSNSSDS